jgi:hypothetical protein
MSELPPLVIGLHGTRGTGKDTLCEAMRKVDHRIKRFAFADELKKDLKPFLHQYYSVDVFTVTGVDKEWIRPLLIEHGMAMRARDPLHWCRKTTDSIIASLDRAAPRTPLVTDVRFENEVKHLRYTFTGGREAPFSSFVLIDVTRDGSPPPTDEEEKHYRDVAAMADIHFHWGNDSTEEQCVKAHALLDDVYHLFDYA